MNINNNFPIKICYCCFAGARIRPHKTAEHLKNLYGINERKYEAFRKWKENASDCVHRRRFIIKRQKRKMDNFICTSLSRPHCITCLHVEVSTIVPICFRRVCFVTAGTAILHWETPACITESPSHVRLDAAADAVVLKFWLIRPRRIAFSH